MTTRQTIDALGAVLASFNNAGSGSCDLSYTSPTMTLGGVSNYWIPTGAQRLALVAAYNAIVGTYGATPPSQLEALGQKLAAISNQEAGACALSYSGLQLTEINSGAVYSASGSQLGSSGNGIVQAFNALSALDQPSGFAGSPFRTGGKLVRSGIIWGQSLMCCYNAGSYTIRRPGQLWSINPQTGQLAAMTNAPTGWDGSARSFMAEFGDLLLDNINAANLVLCNASVGGVSFGTFAKGGSYYARLKAAVDQLKANGLAPDFAILGQGQTDASNNIDRKTAGDQIGSAVHGLRYAGFEGAIVIPRMTISQNSLQPGSQAIKDAIGDVVATLEGVSLGSDWDGLMNSTHRQGDGTHLSAAGCTLATTLCKNDVGPLL